MDQKISIKLEQLNRQAQEFEEKINIVEQQLLELLKFEKSLKDLESSEEKEILAPLGKGVFIEADMKKTKMFVEVGSGIFVKKNLEESKKIAEHQIKKLREIKNHLSVQRENLNQNMKKILEEIANVK